MRDIVDAAHRKVPGVDDWRLVQKFVWDAVVTACAGGITATGFDAAAAVQRMSQHQREATHQAMVSLRGSAGFRELVEQAHANRPVTLGPNMVHPDPSKNQPAKGRLIEPAKVLSGEFAGVTAATVTETTSVTNEKPDLNTFAEAVADVTGEERPAWVDPTRSDDGNILPELLAPPSLVAFIQRVDDDDKPIGSVYRVVVIGWNVSGAPICIDPDTISPRQFRPDERVADLVMDGGPASSHS
jgi:hypothetical protein